MPYEYRPQTNIFTRPFSTFLITRCPHRRSNKNSTKSMDFNKFYNFLLSKPSSDFEATAMCDTIVCGKDDIQSNYPSQPCIALSQPVFKHNEVNRGSSDTERDEGNRLRAAPLFCGAVHTYAVSAIQTECGRTPIYPQYGVLGLQGEISSETSEAESRLHENVILHNTEEPFSAFICGSQGSGKSHTLSCLLENSLMMNTKTSVLNTPLTGLVLHYDKFAGYDFGQVCESAYLSSVNIKVNVLVAPTSLNKMRRQYSNLPGVFGSAPKPKVMPLYFSERQLSVDMMMTLMAVQDTGIAAPLYISAIRQVLREIALIRQDDPGFDYQDFRTRLANLALSQGQCTPLNLRLELLESVLLAREQPDEVVKAFDEMWRFEPGTLTIIDLSDQFVNEGDACALFSICLKLFMDGWRSNPRIIVVDEAHKFLTNTSEASKLTGDLISIIRQQRHLNSRVVIATQEPTVSGDLLDLCNVSIIHRFSSPKWHNSIKAHVAGAHPETGKSPNLLQDIVGLQTGEAVVFCPTAVLMSDASRPQSLGCGSIRLKVRPRNSVDGGKSVRATDRFDNNSSEELSYQPTFLPMNGRTLPRPGSSSGKTSRKGGVNPASSRKVSSQALAVPKKAQAKKQAAAGNRKSLAEAEITTMTTTCSPTDMIAVSRDLGQNGGMQEISQAVLDGCLRTALLEALQTSPKLYAQDTKVHLKAILRKVSVQCNLPPKYLKGHDVLWNDKPTRSATILRYFLKQYCDEQGIPSDQRARLPWLQ